MAEIDNTDKVEIKTAWRFYRSNLSTIVWDARRGTNKPLADFGKGYFTTEDKAVANILREKGYIEIPLNMTEPPALVVNQPAPILNTRNGSVPVMKGAGNITGEAAEKAASGMMDGLVDIPEVKTEQPLAPQRVKG